MCPFLGRVSHRFHSKRQIKFAYKMKLFLSIIEQTNNMYKFRVGRRKLCKERASMQTEKAKNGSKAKQEIQLLEWYCLVIMSTR